ncbi:hypothetical protein D6C89_10112 [Aureobasidium pullulans]|nr:hypothetical protein D6C89_10112 [Aureobasidium pullulans]
MPFADISKPPAPLPSAKLEALRPGLSLQPPLTRRAHGPGLVLLTTAETYDEHVMQRDDAPTAVLKWAEEGYTVVQIAGVAVKPLEFGAVLIEAMDLLERCDACQPKGGVGLICEIIFVTLIYQLGYSKEFWDMAQPALSQCPKIVAGVIYIESEGSDNCDGGSLPLLKHVAGPSKGTQLEAGRSLTKRYHYPTVTGQWYAAGHADFHYSGDSVAHTRNLQFLKPKMGGPYFDLEDIWEEHTYYEFADRSVEHTMSTMVQEPYVNHVPTLTGGVGRSSLSTFYRDNFIFNNSADTDLELISRTIGVDRVIDEFIFKFTHDREIDWLLPGVPPTHRKAEIPFTAVVNIRGDRLYHEHIAWDQGTALKQLGLMPDYLPFPSPLPNGDSLSSDAKLEYRVPVTAEKLRNRKSVPSNQMFEYGVRKKEH